MTTTLTDATTPSLGTGPIEVSYTQQTRAFFFDTAFKQVFDSERLAEEIVVKVARPGDPARNYEFTIAFCLLGDDPRPAARVKVFSDGLAAFTDLAPFFTALAAHHNRRPSPDTVIALLQQTVGATDTTPTQHSGA